MDCRAREPSALFENTYDAIAASGIGNRRPGTRRGVVGWIVPLAGVVLAVLAVRKALVSPAPLQPTGKTFARALPREPLPTGPPVIAAAPVRAKAAVRVGQPLDFAVVASGGDLRFGWTVDGAPAGTGPRWTYLPAPDAVGRHRVAVSIGDRRGWSEHAWVVRVRSARPPRILVAQPARDALEVQSGEGVRLGVSAQAATPDERLRTSWTVDGTPAGDGSSVTLHPPQPGEVTVRAVVTGDLGGTASRVWRLRVLEPPPPPPAAVAGTTPPEPGRVRRAPPVQAALATPPTSFTDEDVHRWLDRYAAAWRARDVEALRRMGQVSTDDEVSALRRYFDHVRELDVELDLIAVDLRRDGAVVRFVRRDRFRDPAGRLVLTESPPIEKQLVRTPDGLHVVHPAPPA